MKKRSVLFWFLIFAFFLAQCAPAVQSTQTPATSSAVPESTLTPTPTVAVDPTRFLMPTNIPRRVVPSPTPFLCPATDLHRPLTIADVSLFGDEEGCPLHCMHNLRTNASSPLAICSFLQELGVSQFDENVHFEQTGSDIRFTLYLENTARVNSTAMLFILSRGEGISYSGVGFPYVEKFSIQEVIRYLGDPAEIRILEDGIPGGVSIILYYPQYGFIYKVTSDDPGFHDNFCLAGSSDTRVEFYELSPDDAVYTLECYGYYDTYMDYAETTGMTPEEVVQYLRESSYCEP